MVRGQLVFRLPYMGEYTVTIKTIKKTKLGSGVSQRRNSVCIEHTVNKHRVAGDTINPVSQYTWHMLCRTRWQPTVPGSLRITNGLQTLQI